MKKGLILLLTILITSLVGCNYLFPVTQERNIPINPEFLGVWQFISEPALGLEFEDVSIVISRKSGTEYAVLYPMEEEEEMFHIVAYHVEIGGLSCIQLKLLGTANQELMKGVDPYILTVIDIEDGEMVIRFINPEVIGTDFTSEEMFRERIIENKYNPELFFFPIKLKKSV